ncbi:MAG TPA: D-2-hydroxyacid dehydrogenase, partial [Clostridiaceae bacterium]|nr:D-2-hydroxyacid dehydrogenase [Clostridiaceae bacterium]
DETEHLINRHSIEQMKNGVIIINTARGPLVNEKDMVEALCNGKVSYYAADVVGNEPICSDHPFLSLPNALITPHIAWAGQEPRTRLIEIAINNVASFLQGEGKNVVN